MSSFGPPREIRKFSKKKQTFSATDKRIFERHLWSVPELLEKNGNMHRTLCT